MNKNFRWCVNSRYLGGSSFFKYRPEEAMKAWRAFVWYKRRGDKVTVSRRQVVEGRLV